MAYACIFHIKDRATVHERPSQRKKESVVRCQRQCVFTDGRCLSPRTPMLTVAGGSVILARSPGPCEVVWSGFVRGLDQSSCLAELLAITDALVFFPCVTVSLFSMILFRW